MTPYDSAEYNYKKAYQAYADCLKGKTDAKLKPQLRKALHDASEKLRIEYQKTHNWS